jgi:hypothetical protein
VGLHAQAIALPANNHANKTYQPLGAASERLEIRTEPATAKYMAEAMRHSAWYFIELVGQIYARIFPHDPVSREYHV